MLHRTAVSVKLTVHTSNSCLGFSGKSYLVISILKNYVCPSSLRNLHFISLLEVLDLGLHGLIGKDFVNEKIEVKET